MLRKALCAFGDLFFISAADAVVKSSSTFSSWAVNWGGIPLAFTAAMQGRNRLHDDASLREFIRQTDEALSKF